MKTALLVVDMQKFFSNAIEAPLPYVRQLCAFFQLSDHDVIFTQHGHTAEELKPPVRNQLLLIDWPSQGLMVGTPTWDFVPEIQDIVQRSAAVVVAKNTYDAFMHTELEDVLKRKGIERVLVCGVLTDFCCDTTARSAFVRGYETWLVSDACGSESEEQHQRGLKNIKSLTSRVYTTAEAIAMLDGEQKGRANLHGL